MKLYVTLIIVTFLGTIACRPSNSGGQLYFSRPEANSLVKTLCARQQFDSALAVAVRYMNGQFDLKRADSAVNFANDTYKMLTKRFQQQQQLAAYLYQRRRSIEADTAALRKAYNLLAADYSYDCFRYRYDPQYVEIGEYVTSLPKKFTGLNRESAIGYVAYLGIICNILGDLKKADTYYNEVYRHDLASGKGTYIASSAINLGIYLNESGQPDSAIRISAAALPLKGVRPDQKMNLLQNMAAAWSQKGETEKSLRLLNQAQTIALDTTQVKQPAEILTTLFHARSDTYFRSGNFAESMQAARLAVPWGIIHHKTYRHRVIGKILQQTAQNYLYLHQPDSALWYYHQSLYTVAQTDSANVNSLPATANIYAENTLMDALDGMANAWDEKFTATGNPDFLEKALQSRQLAFETERKLLETFTYDDAMTNLLQESKQRSKKALLNCDALFRATRKTQWVEQAMQVAEKSKAVVLLHSVKRNRAAMNNSGADSLFSRLQQLRYQEIALVKELTTEGTAYRKDSLQRQQQHISQQYLAAESELNRQHPELKRSGIDSSLLTLKNIYARLAPAGTSLLEFFEADSLTFVIWLGANGRSGIYLPGRGVQAYTREYAGSMQSPGAFLDDSTAFYKTALQCTGLLLPPELVKDLQSGVCRHIIAIPDGRVSLLPLEALVLPYRGGNRYLIEYATVNTGYSISTLLANLDDPELAKAGPLTIFTPFSKTKSQGMPMLPFTNREAEAVQRQFSNSVRYDDTAATKAVFWKSIAGSNIIHVASHAQATDSVIPGIYLHDSVISMSELYATSTQARLVVLSACQTGVGDIDANEGPLSLSRAFYYAGARNVINSLWQVQDDATARIFDYFYKDFPAAGAATALRNAKLRYLRGEDVSRRGPYYWAGLVHAGYEATTMKTSANNKWRWWAALIAALAAIGGLLYYSRRRNR